VKTSEDLFIKKFFILFEPIIIMVATNDFDNVANVIFLIEGTAVNGAYLNEIKQHYIGPTLEYFQGGISDERERENYVSEANSLMYGVVVYKTACMPEVSCVTYGPFQTAQKTMNVIEKLE
jgi:mediator of RNA polymerase II transcription subunit 25